MSKCIVTGCERKIRSNSLCHKHDELRRRTGGTELKCHYDNPYMSPEDRFWARVKQGKPDECWPWQGSCKNGYGTFRVDGKDILVHRFAYALKYGQLPDDMMGTHKCNNRSCCNWDHIKPGNNLSNMQDRKTAGHYATGEANNKCKFSDAIVNEVRVASGTYVEIGRRFSMSATQVANIKNKRQRIATTLDREPVTP